VLIVWICNRTKGSILVAGIAHAAANTGMVFIPVQNMQDVNMIVLVAALVMIVADKMWKKLRFDHPAVYQERILGQEMIKKQ
jgi:hypothetical protein